MELMQDFEYKRPEHLKELLSLLSQHGEEAALIAGGTDLIPRIKMELKRPKIILSLSAVNGLSYIQQDERTLKIGALTTLYELQHHPTVCQSYPAFFEAIKSTASENIRLRATIGGNVIQDTRCLYYNQFREWRASFKPCFKNHGDICNAVKGSRRCFSTYCGDLAPALISLGASIYLMSKNGNREIPLEAIFSGNGVSPFSLRQGELLKEVIIPFSRTIGGYKKLRIRNSIDYPLVSVALSSDQTEKGRLVIGAMGPQPLNYEFSSYKQLILLAGKAYEDATPVANMPPSPLYRKRMIKVLAEELIKSMMN